MQLCSATTKAGEPCKRPAQASVGLCIGHDPAKSAERRRTASRGGRGRVNTEARAVKRFMDELTAKTLSGDIDPKVGAVVNQYQNTKLRAIEVERKLEESDVRQEFEDLKRELGIS